METSQPIILDTVLQAKQTNSIWLFNSVVQNTIAKQESHKNYVINTKSMGHDERTCSKLMSAIAHDAHSSNIWQVYN